MCFQKMIHMTGGNPSEKHSMKNLQNNFPVVTSDSLQSGGLADAVPELYEQKQTVEVNAWHDHQSVFDHTVSVIKAVEQIYRFEFLFISSRDVLTAYLAKEQYGYSMKNLSLFTALLHDIGKAKTMITNVQTGQTDCPEHEKVGSKMSIAVLRRANIGVRTSDHIGKLVLLHGEIHKTVNTVLMMNEPEKEFITFKNRMKDDYILQLIQGYADTLGSDLSRLQPNDLKKREIIYREAINRFAAAL
jgi:hypothetical protein